MDSFNANVDNPYNMPVLPVGQSSRDTVDTNMVMGGARIPFNTHNRRMDRMARGYMSPEQAAIDEVGDKIRSIMLGDDSPNKAPDLSGYYKQINKNKDKPKDGTPTLEDKAEVIARQTAKAWAGYKQDDNGKWVKDDTANTHTEQMERLKSEAAKKQGFWTRLWTSEKGREKAAKPIRQGVEQGFTDSVKANFWNDPRGYIKLWGKYKGYNWLEKFADNPVLFWGGLLAGGIGIASLVSAFIGSRKQQPQGTTINNYYGKQKPKSTVPPASTSFWRLSND